MEWNSCITTRRALRPPGRPLSASHPPRTSRRNLRHHAATKWFHEELGEPWEVVAQYLGDKLTTVLNHYVRAGEDALRDSVNKLADR